MTRKPGRPAILTTTSDDESFLLGTRAQLTEFAERILRLVDATVEPTIWCGIAVADPTCVTSLTDPMSEITLDGVAIVESEHDRRNLMNKIRGNDKLDPIDWEGYDQQLADESTIS